MRGAVAVCCLLLWCSLSPAWSCPWEEAGLLKWSEASTWDNGVPTDGAKVTIPTGKRVLLDTQPASLATLTIEAGGAFIWGDVDDLVLNVHYIWVKGEFHMGAQSCRITKMATIRLHGDENDKYFTTEHEFGRKFLGVAPGGVLEIHGRKKTSWTKLAQTVKPLDQVPNALVYDHSDHKTNPSRAPNTANAQGLNVVVWNKDGSLADFQAFKDSLAHKVQGFLQSVPDGKVVGMFTNGDPWVGSKDQSLVNAITALGGTRIQEASANSDIYALLARKGSSSEVVEAVQKNVNNVEQAGEPPGFKPVYLSLHDSNQHIVFQAAADYWTSQKSSLFRVVHELAAFPKIQLRDQVIYWTEGDEVLFTSTDFPWEQAESRTLLKCPSSECSKNEIKLSEPLSYMHYGNFTHNVDERGEVAMLTRTILIEGVMADECSFTTTDGKKLCQRFNRDTFGGHVMAVRNFTTVRIQGVKLVHMGQQKHRGAYPLHFHMCDDVKGAFIRDNTVVDSFSRCFTIHGTNYLDVRDNVCYKHLGHGLFLEDSVEQFNTIKNNLIVGTQHGTLLLSDTRRDDLDNKWHVYADALSSFWLTHPNNEVEGNVAAGGDGKGYMYVFADLPLGPSRERQEELGRLHHPKDFPLHFKHNVAHSNMDVGIHMDEKISTETGIENKGVITENAVLRCENEYFPHDKDGNPVWADMSYSTFYKNGAMNMWIKGGNVRIAYCSIADSKEGVSGGTTLFETGTKMYKSIFVGESENVGEKLKRTLIDTTMTFNRSFYGDPRDSVTGIGIYQGPILIDSCFFDQFNTVHWCLDLDTPPEQCPEDRLVTRPSGAISYKRSATYPTMTSSYAVNNTFSFCDNDAERHWVFQGADSLPDWDWKDGNKMVYLRDKDGHLTGTPNASIVTNFQLHKGDECQHRPDWGDMLVCPYRYVKLEIVGSGGSLDPKGKLDTPMFIRRDDKGYRDPFNITGRIRNEWLLRTGKSYLIDFNRKTTGAGFPKEMKLFGYGVEKGDEVRVGICQPKDVTGYDVTMDYPAYIRDNATWVDSLEDLDKDTTGAAFFHDKPNGILFFKLMSFHTDTNDTQRCPDGNCWKVVLKVQGSEFGSLRSCFNYYPDPYAGKEVPVTPKKPTTPSCPGPGSPEGLGAVEWDKESYIVQEEFNVPYIHISDPSDDATSVGCYFEKVPKNDPQDLKTNEELFLFQTMNLKFCINRCYYREYKFAAVARGMRCTCSNSLFTNKDYIAQAGNCTEPCKGRPTEKCGGVFAMNVWDTGYSSA